MEPIVFTAVFGGFDTLRLPVVTEGEYVCLCDEQVNIRPPWQQRLVEAQYPPRKQARYCKIMAHEMFPEADTTIWHGGNVQLQQDPQSLITLLGNEDIAMPVHSLRDCAYQEAYVCMLSEMDDPVGISKQVSRYRNEGYPENNGLHAAFLIVRRHTSRIAEFNELWWSEVDGGSVRDQLSIDYCLWKMGIEPVVIPGNITYGPHFNRVGHRECRVS